MPFPDFSTNGNDDAPLPSLASEDASDEIPDDESERFQKARKTAQRFYLILLVLGLSLGAIASIGVVMLLQRLGLTDVPARVEPN